jgi:hypothetical protein
MIQAHRKTFFSTFGTRRKAVRAALVTGGAKIGVFSEKLRADLFHLRDHGVQTLLARRRLVRSGIEFSALHLQGVCKGGKAFGLVSGVGRIRVKRKKRQQREPRYCRLDHLPMTP